MQFAPELPAYQPRPCVCSDRQSGRLQVRTEDCQQSNSIKYILNDYKIITLAIYIDDFQFMWLENEFYMIK